MLTRYSSSGVNQSYQYDGLGRRVSVSSSASTTNYIYDGMNVILERNSAGVTTAGYLRSPTSSGGIGGIISKLSGTSTQAYYQYDGLGSVVNLTNSKSSKVQTYSYDSFGNVIAKSGSSNNCHKFLTKETDASGLIYFGARYYDPTIGRFITQDPMGMIDGPNLYAYCKNNPVNFVDPWGLCVGSIRRNAADPSDILFLVNQYAKVTNLLPYQTRALLSGLSSLLSGDTPFESIGKIAGGVIGGTLGTAAGTMLQPLVPEAPGLPFWFGATGAYSGSWIGGKLGSWVDAKFTISGGEAS
jgi:RHS repeat-associated protein